MSSDPRSTDDGVQPPWASWIAVSLPLAALALLLARPEIDLQWEHHPSHFWLVLVTAAVNVALAYLTNVVAGRQGDARLILISLAFLASAGFLGLHALATPGVLLEGSNAGFAIATPVGLFVASGFAAASVTPLVGTRSDTVLRHRSLMLAGLVALMVVWGVISLAGLPPLDGPPPETEAIGPLSVLAAVSVGLYAFSAWRTLGYYRQRGGIVVLAIGVALVLLGEAMIAVALSRNWRLSWWEWHLLMLMAFAAIALGARNEYRRTGSLSAAFGGLYLETTLARIEHRQARAIAAVAMAAERGESTDRILAELRRDGASAEEVALLSQAADEVRRVDALVRPYLPSHLATRLRNEPGISELGGAEREVSVLFADLAGFTSFSETRSPTEVLTMLNAYWAVVVPAVEQGGGVVEHFAGDGLLASFNAAGDLPEHAGQACATALAIIEAGRPLAAANADWPIFRAGVNTGLALVGNVGAEGRRSFTVIGDTTNLAARLLALGEPGQVVVAAATWDRLGPGPDGIALAPTRVKGKREPVRAWVLRGLEPAASSDTPPAPSVGHRSDD